MFKKQQNQKQKRKKREDKFSLKDCLKRPVVKRKRFTAGFLYGDILKIMIL